MEKAQLGDYATVLTRSKDIRQGWIIDKERKILLGESGTFYFFIDDNPVKVVNPPKITPEIFKMALGILN